MGENKHLTPVWIVYVDGKRLDTDHEGALERIVIDDKLNGVGTGVLEFDSSMIKIRDSGTFSLESYVSVHLGYKDDCEQVFAGEVTEFKGDFSEYGHERVKVVCKNCLHKLQNALQSLSFEAKSPAAVLKARLGVYGLKGEIEDFGAVRNYFVESGLSDYEYLLQTARKYGKTVYGYDDTVYIKDEVTVSDEEVILEWGKSLISFRCSENLKGQLSSCTFVGWDENNCEGITGSAGLSDIPVKVGGDSSWEDNSKGASGTWKAVFTADDLYDNEDAKNRAIGYLQNISMEYQTGVGKCEGNRHVFPGMRVTIKYVGEHFSGEYIAERVVHEVSVNGPFTTEVYVKRNMTAGGGMGESVELDKNMGMEQEGSSMFHVGENMEDKAQFTSSMDADVVCNFPNNHNKYFFIDNNQNTFKITKQFDFSSRIFYIPIEGIGINTGSHFSLSCIFTDNSLSLFASGWFIGENLVDNYNFVGSAILLFNNIRSERKYFKVPDYNYISKGDPYKVIGEVKFFHNFSKKDKLVIILDFVLQLVVDSGVNKAFYPYPSKRIVIQ